MKKPPNKPKPGDPVSAAFFSAIIDSILSIQDEMKGLIINSGQGYRVSRSSNGTILIINRQPYVPVSPYQNGGIKPGGFKCKIEKEDKETKLYASGGYINTYDGSTNAVEPLYDWKELCILGKEDVSAYVDINLSKTGAIENAELKKELKPTKPFRPKDPDMKQASASRDASNEGEASPENHVSVEIAKVKVIPPEEGEKETTYELIQLFEGSIELQLFGIQEQENIAANSSDVYGGEYALLKEVQDRTAILRKLKGEEGINLTPDAKDKAIDIKLVKANSNTSTPRLGGVSGVEVTFITPDSPEAGKGSWIEEGIIKIFIPKETDSNDLQW